jgi:hypothetical protein
MLIGALIQVAKTRKARYVSCSARGKYAICKVRWYCRWSEGNDTNAKAAMDAIRFTLDGHIAGCLNSEAEEEDGQAFVHKRKTELRGRGVHRHRSDRANSSRATTLIAIGIVRDA